MSSSHLAVKALILQLTYTHNKNPLYEVIYCPFPHMCNGARNMKMATWDSLESRWVIKQCSVSNICSVKIDKARGELELVSQTWVKPNLRLKTFSKWRVCISRLNRYLWNWLFKSGGEGKKVERNHLCYSAGAELLLVVFWGSSGRHFTVFSSPNTELTELWVLTAFS